MICKVVREQVKQLDVVPDRRTEMSASFANDLKGQDYLDYLKSFHIKTKPRTYLEIGTRSGDSLALAQCPSVAIDPNFGVAGDAIGKKSSCLFFQRTSDDFFYEFDPTVLLGGRLDFSFLDGLHLFEFLLRDFINTEKSCDRDSIIAMHDCIPTDVYVSLRDDNPEYRRRMGSKPHWWTGDVWKIAPVLKRWRPDIKLIALDCAPSGLLLATNLNPRSPELSNNYERILQEFAEIDLSSYGLQRFLSELNLQSCERFGVPFKLWGGTG